MASGTSAHLQLVVDGEIDACSGCARRAQALALMEVDLQNAEVSLRAERRKSNLLQGQLNKMLAEQDPHADLADVVFTYWKAVCSPRAREFGRQRRLAVSARLKGLTSGPDAMSDGEALLEILRAIDGASHDAYAKDGKAYNDLELICRDPVTLQRNVDRQDRWENRTDIAVEKLIWPEGVPSVEEESELDAFKRWYRQAAERAWATVEQELAA